MSEITFGLLLAAFISGPADEPENHSKLQESLGRIIGTWQNDEGDSSYRWGLDGQVIVWTPSSLNARATFYWDPSEKKIKVIAFGTAGWHVTGRLERTTPDKLVWSMVNVDPKGRRAKGTATYTWNGNDELVVHMKIDPGQATDERLEENKVILKRVATSVADTAKINVARAQLKLLSQALQIYCLDLGTFPTTRQGLATLRVAPDDKNTKWRGPYLKDDVPLDPWGKKYLYEKLAGRKVRIWSAGPDGKVATRDDLVLNVQ